MIRVFLRFAVAITFFQKKVRQRADNQQLIAFNYYISLTKYSTFSMELFTKTLC